MIDVFTSDERTRHFPRMTEVERLVVQRIEQDIFHERLLDYWEGKCAVTGLAVPKFLRASHIKPWASCDTDEERLDVYNGLLLAPHIDAVFDKGFIKVADDGTVVVSARLDAEAQVALGLTQALHVHPLGAPHREYLAWHRLFFERRGGGGP